MNVTDPPPQGTPAPEPAVSPWVRMARDNGREWFRDHPGAPLDEFTAAAEAYEADQVLAAGHGWQPGDPVTEKVQAAMDAAWVGSMAARDDEAAVRARHAAALDGWAVPEPVPGGRLRPYWAPSRAGDDRRGQPVVGGVMT